MTRILRNRLLPPPAFAALNLCGLVLARPSTPLSPQLLNHERIHTAQMRETLFVGFYLWYVGEWLVRLVLCRRPMQAYRLIRFEQEAYRHGDDLGYLARRRPFAWLREPGEKPPNPERTR